MSNKVFTLSFLFFALALVFAPVVHAQRVVIPGDTTNRAQNSEDSVKYGPNTTTYIYKDAFKYNQVEYDTLDTLIEFAHRFSRVEQSGSKLQYLGTIGTANTPIFPVIPKVSGATSGLNAYDIYVNTPEDVKYYDTQSPYSQLYLTFGGNNRNIVDVSFARNVTPNWSVGASLRTITADKQTARAGRGDRRSESYFMEFFTFFKSQNDRYRFMGHFGRLNHEVNETGGVVGRPFDENLLQEYFRYNNSDIYLNNFVNREFRLNYHIYHEYKLSDRLQFYHEIDRKHQNVFFLYNPGNTGIDTTEYFRRTLVNDAVTADRLYYDEWDTEIGLKGKLASLFYSLHYRLRRPMMDYIFVPDFADVELYGGFDLRLELGENTFLSGGADYQSTQNYRIEAIFNNPILKGSYTRSRNLPSYLSLRYLGNHSAWENDFEPVGMDQIKGSIEYQFPFIYLRPFVTLTNINKPIYYRRDTPVRNDTLFVSRQAVPAQVDGAVQILSPGLEFSVDFLKRMHFRGEAIYTLMTGRATEAFAIPSIYASGSLYYQNKFIEDKITLQIGVDFQLTPSYLSYDYDVATQQFFTQQRLYGTNNELLDNFETPFPTEIGYIVFDAFVNLKVRTAIVYLKMPYVNQGMVENGYFTTPYYVGQPRVLDVGIKWLFFD
ncbi:putative porin [Catalinimonas niigatensis]|uniref:putative porin n=1 Tax=Catalinimonas niigatensis TaxID=1397264 RepID=UPI0026668A28|nr:putative porin [Catalinimonas niigatensis]WPP53100.1 putative porin [Catalinimonas niigatensis]